MPFSGFRRWIWVHTWSSLICTLFLLLACVTGLPLIFHEEIDTWLEPGLPYASLPVNAPRASLDVITARSHERYPQEIILSVTMDDDEPKVVVFMASSWQAFLKDTKVAHALKFDARTAQILRETRLGELTATLTGFILKLHKDLFAGTIGEYLLAAMAILFLVALVSGVVVYGPFMRHLDFGTLRVARSRRLKWLDVHNLLGGLALVWMVVVGATGIMNELSTPLFDLWRSTEVRSALKARTGTPVLSSELAPLQAAYERAETAMPGNTVSSVIFPGSSFSTPYHYVFWAKGQQPLTARLFIPILIDGRTGSFDGTVHMPWYLRALEISRPLHFGDYGGLALKLIWALFDLATIVVLATGLYLWMTKAFRKSFARDRNSPISVIPAAAAK
ncbi:PepSY-associated TM helix domain-containing protein [Bradyrhizobium sp. dw_411]|uniref:PepSY-associated TM helix domain-containing protein n=1 Tax=Bradyrhizobium sp. dw_411 TaxID=2720082 RepID=UPI001BCDADB0|nr:PepSY-associated TM helix domain-containing protein [Bradyrhizobium sp. dw_411]